MSKQQILLSVASLLELRHDHPLHVELRQIDACQLRQLGQCQSGQEKGLSNEDDGNHGDDGVADGRGRGVSAGAIKRQRGDTQQRSAPK